MIKIIEQDLEELQERVLRLKMVELFEEPSSYEDEEDSWHDRTLMVIYKLTTGSQESNSQKWNHLQ